MPIVVTCGCGQRFQAIDTLAGKRVPCPVCQSPIDIPHLGINSDPLGIQSGTYPAPFAGASPTQQSFAAQRPAAYPTGAPRGQRAGGFQLGMPVITACGAVVLVLMFVYAVVKQSIRNFVGDGGDVAFISGDAGVNQPVLPQERWQTFTSEAGGFQVDLPGELDFEPSPTHPQSPDIESGQVTADLPQGGSLTVTWSLGNVPYQSGKTPRDILDGVRDGLISAVQGTAQSDHPITVQGHPGTEVLIWGTFGERPGTLAARFFLVGRDYYQLNWVAPGYQATVSNDARRVFDSFRLTHSK